MWSLTFILCKLIHNFPFRFPGKLTISKCKFYTAKSLVWTVRNCIVPSCDIFSPTTTKPITMQDHKHWPVFSFHTLKSLPNRGESRRVLLLVTVLGHDIVLCTERWLMWRYSYDIDWTANRCIPAIAVHSPVIASVTEMSEHRERRWESVMLKWSVHTMDPSESSGGGDLCS